MDEWPLVYEFCTIASRTYLTNPKQYDDFLSNRYPGNAISVSIQPDYNFYFTPGISDSGHLFIPLAPDIYSCSIWYVSSCQISDPE